MNDLRLLQYKYNIYYSVWLWECVWLEFLDILLILTVKLLFQTRKIILRAIFFFQISDKIDLI